MTVGRNKQCSCVLKDDSASSRHIRVVEDRDGLAIEDLGSTNGVRLESGSILVRGSRQRLVEGLRFWLGETEILVGEQKPAVPKAAAPGPAARKPAAPAPPPPGVPASAPSPPDSEQTLARSPTPGKSPGAPPPARAPEPPRKEPPVPVEEATLGGASPFRVGSGLANPPRAPATPPAEVEEAPTLGGASPFRVGGPPARDSVSKSGPGEVEDAPTLGGAVPFRPGAGRGPASRAPDPAAEPAEEAPTLSGGMQFAFRVGPEALSPRIGAGAPAADAPFVLESGGASSGDEEMTMLSAKAAPRAGGAPPPPARLASPPAPGAEPDGGPPRAPSPEPPVPAAAAGARSGPFEATQFSTPSAAGSQESLEALDPRIVLILGQFKRVVRMRGPEFVVGRGEEVDLEIVHPTISNRHAVIRFERGQFTIEDGGSKNGTFLDKMQLRENSRYDLRPESHVRFAAADALFLAKDAADPDGSLDRRAAKILVGRKKVTPAQVKSAASAGGHIGERLLLETDLQVSDWVAAAREASMSARSPMLGGKLVPVVLGALAIIIIALLLVWLWK